MVKLKLKKNITQFIFIPLMWITLVICSTGMIPAGGPPAHGPSIHCRIWRNVPGAQATDILATTQLSRSSDEDKTLDTLEFAPDYKDPWAASLTAILTAPKTGAYWFRIASADTGMLFLSSDTTVEHRQFICENPAGTDIHSYKYYSAQTSNGIRLEAGHRYLIQAIVKSGPGPGVISIGWQPPGGTFQGPIPPQFFSPPPADVPVPSLRVEQFSLSLKPEPAPATQPSPIATTGPTTVPTTVPTTGPTTVQVNSALAVVSSLHSGINKFVRGAQFQVDGQTAEMSYLMYAPKDYDTTTDARPMLVFLHGNSRQGYTLEQIESLGPIKNLQRSQALRDWMPMIVMAPQLPPDWRWDTPGAAQAVNGLVEQLCRRYPRIDRRRIYLTGLSMGGKGTWLTLENSPQTYAAVVPISAVDIRPDLAPQLLKNLLNLHIVCGSEDGGFTAGSHRMYEALKPVLGDRVQLTVFPHEGHNVWEHYYSTQSFYEDLMKYAR